MTATVGCPGCVAAPERPSSAAPAADVLLHLPGIHCAGCIATAEDTLNALPGVSAHVNLSRRRATVATGGRLEAAPLIEALAAVGIEAHELDVAELAPQDRTGRDLLMRIGVSGFAMMNVMLLSVAVWSGAADTTRQLFHLISALIAVPAIVFSARPFFVSALGALRAARLNMDVPIALAILLATLISAVEALQGGEGHAWFEAALSLTFFLLAGRYLDHASRSAARSAAKELSALEVPRATRLTDGGEEVVRAADLRAGDAIRVAPGMRLPADGIVAEGRSELDRALLTGETLPVGIAPGDPVEAGTLNLTGPLVVTVARAGRDTALSRLADLVATAEAARTRYASLADRAARAYAPVVHLLALAAFAGWFWGTGDALLALGIAVAVLIITCPCALGLAVPAVSIATSGRLFRKGLLVKSNTALERLAEVDTVIFDKTGTLTEGAPVVVGEPAVEDVRLAMALAEGSVHPLALAIVAHGRARGLTPVPVEDRVEHPGLGIAAVHNGQQVRLGRAAWVGAAEADRTATWLDRGDGAPVAIGFTDRPRAGAEEAVSRLKGLGLRVELISGDAAAPVADLAGKLGIEAAKSGLTPAKKAAHVEALAAGGRTVLMVGDGLNDTGALAAAHASIAPASALDAARAVSDVVLLNARLDPVADAVIQARAARRRMGENIWLALAYNAVAIPVALAGFATPLLAALAMSASSITVSLNALRAPK
ncbi:heavy metal translocating P-type ATPase [Aestuariibius sp. 2305UL40-4]|uniref:heavy metal translocating P-type ATPase n=1 Tax=Aestuariibius violaceus TaxID=3234132 RepID=UPI00345F04BC